MSTNPARSPLLALAVVAAAALSGCEATFTPAPVTFAYDRGDLRFATVVPSNIYAYPAVPFDGTYAYLVNGQWYVPTPRGWMVYLREPTELGRYRTRIRPRAPYPAYPPAPPPLRYRLY